MLRQTPLQLRELFFPRISVQAAVSVGVGPERRAYVLDDLDINFAFDLFDEGTTASAVLRLATKEPSASQAAVELAYAFDVEVVASFGLVSPEHTDPLALYLRKVAAAAALLGAAREQVAMTSARGPWGPVTLPLISMDGVVGPPPPRAAATPAPAVKKVAAKKPATASRSKT